MINGKKVLALIPVRGGSKGIPRKNARLMAGKPLVSYVLEACKRSKYIDEVFVSTDDAELEEIATRFGAKVIARPSELALDHVGLDEVVVATVPWIETRVGEGFDYIVSLQATSPLLKTDSIDSGIELIDADGLDTVLSAQNEPHLSWAREDGQIIPNYEKRLNRQYLPEHLTETGGFFICTRPMIDSGTRFGTKVGVIEVSREESIDVDDRFDWWMAEKSLTRRKICLHVIGNHQDGLGHIYRQLTLADRIIDDEVIFLANEEADVAIQKAKERFYPIKIVPKGGELAAIRELKPDVLINDVLNTSQEFMCAVKDLGIKTVNFEDLGEGALLSDVLINSMFEEVSIPHGRHYQGIEFACLRDEFYSADPIKVSPEVKSILLLFGGTDPFGLTERCLQWVLDIHPEASISVVLGLGKKDNTRVKEIAAASTRVEIIENTSIVSRYMSRADLAITSAGRTVYELGSLGVPCITIAANEREMSHSYAVAAPGVAFAGQAANLDEQKFKGILNELISNPSLREKMHQDLFKYDFRGGINRVLKLINEVR